MKQFRLPIAMLHHVSNREEWRSLRPFVISEATFMRFLDAIERAQMQPVTFKSMQETENTQDHSKIIISFDDCGKHLLNFAVPELIRRNFSAVFYIPTANIGGFNTWNVEQGRSKVPLMDESEIIQLQRLGMEVGGHSHDHVRLGSLNDKEVLQQLQSCQSTLTRILGQPATSFAYPYGSIPSNAKALLETNGFHDTCAIFSPRQERHMQRRFIVHDGDSPLTMRAKLTGLYRWYRSLTDPRKPESSWQ